MIAYATKTSLTKFLRSRGLDIPSSRDVRFSRHMSRSWYTLSWRDRDGQLHWADYSVYSGTPALNVDNDMVPITTEEAESYGLIRQ